MISRRPPSRPDARKAREGATAVEFAFVAIPFLIMSFAIMELGAVYLVDSVAQNAALQASRLVRTGQAEAQSFNAAKFKQAFCDNMGVFKTDCATRTTVDVRVVASFKDDIGDLNNDGVADNDGYDGGTASELMIVRIWYRQPMLSPFLSQLASKGNSGQIVLASTVAFRNEPWNA